MRRAPSPADWRPEPATPVAVLAAKHTVGADTPVVPVAELASKHVPVAKLASKHTVGADTPVVSALPPVAEGVPSDDDGPEVAGAWGHPHTTRSVGVTM